MGGIASRYWNYGRAGAIIFSVFGRVKRFFFFFRLKIFSLVVMGEPVPVVNLTAIRLITISDLRGR